MEEIFLSRDKADIIECLAALGISWPSCPNKFWMLTYFVILHLPNATAQDRIDAQRFIYSQGGLVQGNKLYHEQKFNPAHVLEPGLNLG